VIPALVRKCVEAVRRGAPSIEAWGTGTATRDYLYVDDAAAGIVLAAERYDGAEPVNVSSDAPEVSMRELAPKIAQLAGFEGRIVWDSSRPDGQPRRKVDGRRARELFGFEARVALDEGLRRTIDWYRQQV
jgi:GDP-L-fucose synthase